MIFFFSNFLVRKFKKRKSIIMSNDENFFIENLLKIINFLILCQLKEYLRIWIEEINNVSLKKCEIIFKIFTIHKYSFYTYII